MNYIELIALLKENAEENFAQFQRRLISTKYTILGVRTPKMREIARLFKGKTEDLLSFPNEYYEVVFIKLAVVSMLGYEELLVALAQAVSLMDNWALCDCFRPKCIKNKKDLFLPEILSFLEKEGEFERRFALVMLLVYYVEEQYLPVIKGALKSVNTQGYYTHMAAAWLLAEVLVKHYEYGKEILNEGFIPPKTHDKAIQKARESYRLTKAQKAELNALKIKNTER